MKQRAAHPLVRMTGITKRFGRITVLDGVDFEARGGEVHVLVGENGAGKSTLIKILAGVHTDFGGRIELEGQTVRLRSPLHANELGIAVIHQELSLIGPMSVADNILLGHTPTRLGLVRDADQRRIARQQMRSLGIDVDVDCPVMDLPIAIQQLVEIAKALSRNARVIVMDEPTSALCEPEVDRLFELIGTLTQRGCGVVYITHKMEEIERVADHITVLRDGQLAGSAPAGQWSGGQLVEQMIGQGAAAPFTRRSPGREQTRLRLEDFRVYPSGDSKRPAVKDISLDLAAGQVIGIAGLQGSGASDLLMGLFGGHGRRTDGQVRLDDRPVRFDCPRQAIDAGVALLTNDRQASGLVLPMSVAANATLAALPSFCLYGWRQSRRETALVQELTDPLRLRAASLDTPVANLSGGNQQKVAIAKWLAVRPRVLLLDEPTRGVDIGAKREIYRLINQWTDHGIAILLITSELPELLELSDHIIVLLRGEVTARFDRDQANAHRILHAAMGQTQEAVAG